MKGINRGIVTRGGFLHGLEAPNDYDETKIKSIFRPVNFHGMILYGSNRANTLQIHIH